MKKHLLTSTLLFLSLLGFSKTWTVTNSGTTFSPATLTIQVGDTVIFTIAGSHDAREVSQATWNANGTTALSGGFQTPFGGGTVLPNKLGVGTHYYVCTNHAAMGMKGTIIVENSSGIQDVSVNQPLNLYPNPSSGRFQVELGNLAKTARTIEIYSITGQRIYSAEIAKPMVWVELPEDAIGIFILKISGDEALIEKKILVQ